MRSSDDLEMSDKILRFVHDELYMELRFMGIALSALSPEPDKRVTTFATDGTTLFFSMEQLFRLFRKNPAYLNRLYLHTVFHCIFSHLWICGSRDRFLWGIACDIAVEYAIDSMDKPCTKRILSWSRQRTYEALRQIDEGISAAQIYRYLSDKAVDELQELHQEFFADDHVFWPKEEQHSAGVEAARKKWDRISRQTRLEQNRRGHETEEGGEAVSFQMKAGKSRRRYQDFLKKFAVLEEELHSNPDEFDLGFYTYGLTLYRNMPLIEPLESREIKKIKEFVVVVDTSYSTSGELVENFLKETFSLLCQEDSFFRRCKLHVVQCDEEVREDIVITDKEQLDSLFLDFKVRGGGGTDFRPAFTYVDELCRQGEFKNLCGMLYFTDGKGIYPAKKPEYKTAFLFLEDYDEEMVPAWAIRLRLEEEEFLTRRTEKMRREQRRNEEKVEKNRST